MNREQAAIFIDESNAIENIHRPATEQEVDEFMRFMSLRYIAIVDLQKFVRIYQPDAELREKVDIDVYVGFHKPPIGGPDISRQLNRILDKVNHRDISIYDTHRAYEELHPFTDGNGRSGRMLWMWQMRSAPLGFLHTFYYQSLDGGPR